MQEEDDDNKMRRCARCCLRNSSRAINLVMLLLGVGTIIYSLWLQRKWDNFLLVLPLSPSLPKPWFIYTCLGVGMALCFCTLCGHVVANYSTHPTIFFYILIICCLLFLEVAATVWVFFKMDWKTQIAAWIDEYGKEFGSFVTFHLMTCRFIIFFTLAVQVIVVILSAIVWAVGAHEPITHYEEMNVRSFTQSFLVPISPGIGISHSNSFITRESFLGENQRTNFFSRIESLTRLQLQRVRHAVC